MRRFGGQKDWVYVRRFRCQKCSSYHVELPDCLIPYKHYQTQDVSDVLDGVIAPDDQYCENYPSLITMIRWLAWFNESVNAINGYLRQASRWVRGQSDETSPLCLEFIRENVPSWLSSVVRIIYNSGGKLKADS